MSAKYIVYALIDPVTLFVRYIGRSSNGVARLQQHRYVSAKDTTYSARWKRSLTAAGLKHIEHVLEECSSADELRDAEIWWIAYGRATQWPLTNITSGGEGMTGWSPSVETRAKIGAANTGRVQSAAARAANARAQTGRRHSDETKGKMRDAAIIRMSSPEARERVRVTSSNYTHSEETRAKMRTVIRKSPGPMAEETKLKISKSTTTRQRIKGRFV